MKAENGLDGLTLGNRYDHDDELTAYLANTAHSGADRR